MRTWLRLACAVLLLARPAQAEWVDWVFDADLAARFDANASRAAAASEEVSDFATRLGVRAGRAYQLAERTRAVALADLGGEAHARFEDLDSLDAGGRLVLLHKIGLGDAPWIRASVDGGWRELRAHRRSGPFFGAGVALGRRLSERLDARLHWRFARRWAKSGPAVVAGARDDVFDQSHHEVGVDAGLQLAEPLLLSSGFAYRRGDFDSNARGSRFRVLASDDVEAVARDSVFGGWVYRIEGNAYSAFVGLDWALGDHWSAALAYHFQYAEGGGLDYASHGARAALLYRY